MINKNTEAISISVLYDSHLNELFKAFIRRLELVRSLGRRDCGADYQKSNDWPPGNSCSYVLLQFNV